MKFRTNLRKCGRGVADGESGAALLIAIFVLLLVSVVGIALIVASGTQTALTGNYHSATAVYYAALSGLEEGRSRLLTKGPNAISAVVPAFMTPGTPVPLGTILYIVNSGVDPTDGSSSNADLEYDTESFATPLASATVYTTPTIANTGGYQSPLIKWIRINAVTERAIRVNVDGSGVDNVTPLYYDGSHLNRSYSGNQAMEVTALAAFPNGSQKILQYVVAPESLNLNVAAAITLNGSGVQFSGPSSPSFVVDGNDSYSVGACAPGATAVAAIGYTDSGDSGNIATGNVLINQNSYTGFGGTKPNVRLLTSLPPDQQTVGGLSSLVQKIMDNADVKVTGPVTQSDGTNIMPPTMSAANPAIVAVEGDLNINGWHGVGFGILLVTGDLTYDPEASWNGIVLVIGNGHLISSLAGPGSLNGAVYLAKTVGSTLGDSNFDFASGANSAGVHYSSCWVKAVQRPLSYKILLFREIPT